MLRNGLQPVAEEEDAAAWLLSPGATVGAEQEDAWDWVRGIASGVATGASTGAALGPYGALVGGLVGGGLGALQTAQQQQGAQGSSSAAGAARNPAVPTNPATIQTPSGIDGSNRPATAGVTASQPSGDVLSQLAALLPVLIQVLSSSSARAPRAESVPIESGDLVPDEAFL